MGFEKHMFISVCACSNNPNRPLLIDIQLSKIMEFHGFIVSSVLPDFGKQGYQNEYMYNKLYT